MNRPSVLALVLAGGEGSRLGPLTDERAKPALPFAGTYRLIDFPLSNCLHSGIGDVWVIQQYEPHELTKQLANGRPWDLDRTRGGLRILHPYLGDSESGWYEGNADAIYSNRQVIADQDPDVLLVLSADHVRVVQLVDMVGGEHEQHVRILVGNHLPVAVDRIGIPLVPATLGITEVGMQDPQSAARAVEVPGPSVGELLRQFVRLVLLDHPDVADATVEAIRQGEIDQPVSAGKGEGRLRAFVGQGAKAAAFSTREHKRQNARSVHLKAAR